MVSGSWIVRDWLLSNLRHLNVDLVWDVTTQEDFPQSVAIHRNLASGDVPELVFGRNEPALIYYHQNIAKYKTIMDAS